MAKEDAGPSGIREFDRRRETCGGKKSKWSKSRAEGVELTALA